MTPTGRFLTRDGARVLTLSREFRAPIEDVWAAVIEPERLARWIGTWTGDPASGEVAFAMTAEGDDVEAETMVIRACEPPHRLHLTTRFGDQSWLLELDLTHADGVTTLVFSQPGIAAEQVGDVAPGWEYYLDRLVAAETGGDVGAVDFERDYHPAMSAPYVKAFAEAFRDG
jgi:uncharacterized protein YndB with AHSA1/START domain